MKLCINCKHHVQHGEHRMVWCKHPNNGIDLTDGSTKPMSATINRGSNASWMCGEHANWFEQKEPAPKGWWELFWSFK